MNKEKAKEKYSLVEWWWMPTFIIMGSIGGIIVGYVFTIIISAIFIFALIVHSRNTDSKNKEDDESE